MRRKGTKVKFITPRENVYAAPEFRPIHGPSNSLLTPRVIEDVYDHKPITAMASIRDDPLGRYYARGQIDFSQWSAAVIWLRWWERATLGGLKGYELKDPVDGGGQYPEALSDQRKEAVDQLAFACYKLGIEGDQLLRDVLGHRRFINEVVVSRGFLNVNGGPRQREIDYLSRRFRECLETLAECYGLTSPKYNAKSGRQLNGHTSFSSFNSVAPSS